LKTPISILSQATKHNLLQAGECAAVLIGEFGGSSLRIAVIVSAAVSF